MTFITHDIRVLLACILLGVWAAFVSAQTPTACGVRPPDPATPCGDGGKDGVVDSTGADYTSVLDEFVVEGIGDRSLVRRLRDGGIEVRASMISDMPTILGGGDMLSAIRSVGAISTASELTASFSVHGLPTGSTLYSCDGVRTGNPLHLLGLYSTYVPGMYDSYILDTTPDVCLSGNTSAAVLDARADLTPDTVPGGSICIGMIESHASVDIPLCATTPTSLTMALRGSYIDRTFPSLLKAGYSTIGYSFIDGGVRLVSQLSPVDRLSVSLTGCADRLRMPNERKSEKEVYAGWRNLTAGIELSRPRLTMGAGICRFNNVFEIEEAMRSISLPSILTDISLNADYLPGNDLRLHVDSHVRWVSGQYNKDIPLPADALIPGKSVALEVNPAIGWSKRVNDFLELDAGVRFSWYMCRYGDKDFIRFHPQPRVAVCVSLPCGLDVSGAYSRLMRFDRLVEESTTGMPVNFFINSCSTVPPEDNHSFELEFSGRIPVFLLSWQIRGYYVRMYDAAEYGGGMLNFISPGDPLVDFHFGNGYSRGVSVSLSRQFGSIRGRVNYDLGRSMLRIPYFSDDYFPSSSDRTHDLSASLAWQMLKRLTLAVNFIYATGTPFTEAKYGYIIGENLICEYFPHNSSRLPAYKRLDLSFSWRLRPGKLNHEFNLSIYNALASGNTLFLYNSYSKTEGVTIKRSVMRSVIPSVAYTLSF